MVILEAIVVIGLVGVIVYSSIRLLTRPPAPKQAAPRTGRWLVAHYDVKDETHVVLQKVAPDGLELLDEHVIETIRVDDPEYDARFLTAMSTARERRALFESEETD